MTIPKIFISYSHDSSEHKQWVLELAIRLRNNGIDAILDQFDLKPGDDLPHFMESNLDRCDKIIMVCSNNYVEKANGGQGGVGYEKMILTSTMLKNINESKIIPIVRQQGSVQVPIFMKSKLYINFSMDDSYEFSYDELIRTIHNSPLIERPPIGNNPFQPTKTPTNNSFQPTQTAKISRSEELLHAVLREILSLMRNSSLDVATSTISTNLKISRGTVNTVVDKLVQLGYAEWIDSDFFVQLTKKGRLYAFDNDLLGN